jgi:RNA-directed DNA polymerase
MSVRYLRLARGGKAMRPKSSMHGGKKSDPPIVAKKPTNNAAPAAAEPAEPRGGTKGNAGQQSTPRTQSRTSVSPALDRVRQAARERPKEQLTALSHHVTVDLLQAAYAALRREAAPGADGVTWSTYGENLEANLLNLHQRVHRGAYRAQPSRRRYIPKSDGKMRPLGIASLEDKIVQKAVVEILNAIYEEEFLGFSYGFRPGRGQHDALDALAVGLTKQSVGWVLDADIKGFFDRASYCTPVYEA